MTNKDKYKQAFSVLHASGDFTLEVDKMNATNSSKRIKRLVATAAAVCLMLAGSATVAYAADIAGIQRTVQIWTRGEQTEATIEFDGNGNYNMNYTDENGDVKQHSGGGIAYLPGGRERPLTEEELLEELTAPEVFHAEDGSTWVYWYDQKVEITDKYQGGVCYITIINGKKKIYMTITEDGYASSPHKYIDASELD